MSSLSPQELDTLRQQLEQVFAQRLRMVAKIIFLSFVPLLSTYLSHINLAQFLGANTLHQFHSHSLTLTIAHCIPQEIGYLTNSLQQLKAAQEKYTQSAISLDALKAESDGAEVLVPLTGTLYAPGHLASGGKVLVDVGTGYYLEKVLHSTNAL